MRSDYILSIWKAFARAVLFSLCLFPSVAFSQARTVGVLQYDSARSFRGYTLFAPLRSNNTYLIDNEGRLVHSWTSNYIPGQAAMLLRDGSLLRAAMVRNNNPFASQGGVAGRVERFDWNGNLAWSYEHLSSDYSTHHDVEMMPNGNVLLIAWERKSMAEVVAAGRNTSGATYTDVWSEKVIEVRPDGASGGTIVWEWHIWDHLVQDFDQAKNNYDAVAEHPELMDINFGDKKTDWLHMNAVRYNPVRDEIMVSVHSISEFWVIDHSTTTAEAAGHSGGKRGRGGDILYRWGNPRAYKTGTAADQKLYSQHDARWIEPGLPGAGNILIFNNGTNRPGGAYSSVEEITPPIAADSGYTRIPGTAFGPAASSWTWKAQPPSSFYAVNISGATRMSNGNTVICQGPAGRFLEITSAGDVVWEYVNPVGQSGPVMQGVTPTDNIVFKIHRYAVDDPGLAGRDLTPKGTIETYPTEVTCLEAAPGACALEVPVPHPARGTTAVRFTLPGQAQVRLQLFDLAGHCLRTLVDAPLAAGRYDIPFDAGTLSAHGILLLRLTAGAETRTRVVILSN
jgi:hypothetical protein